MQAEVRDETAFGAMLHRTRTQGAEDTGFGGFGKRDVRVEAGIQAVTAATAQDAPVELPGASGVGGVPPVLPQASPCMTMNMGACWP